MAVPAGPTEKRYTGNGVTKIFTIPFLLLAASDLDVFLDGVEIVSGFTITGAGNPTSTITFAVAPADQSSILLNLNVPFERLNDYQENGDFLSSTVNRDFDRIWQALKQLLRISTRSLTLGFFDVDGAGAYRSKGNRIADLADPIGQQDAATKNWVGLLLDGVSGVVNTTLGIAYDAGTLFDYLRFGLGRSVDNIAALRLLSSARNQRAFALGHSSKGDGGGGAYFVDTLDTTSVDNVPVVVVADDGARWKLKHSGVIRLEQFGAVGNGMHDTAMAAALIWAQSPNTTTEFANAKLTFGAGKSLNLAGSYSISVPIQLEILSAIHDLGVTGTCFTLGATFSNRHTGWDIKIPQGVRCVNGNTALPTSVSATGRSFMEIRRMQFSEIDVGSCIAFPRFGYFLNGSEDQFANQHVQHNKFSFGQTAYNGVGIKTLSSSAITGGVQANKISVQNVFSNFHNIDIDDNTHSNSTNNLWIIQAMDLHAPGGYGLNCFSSFNRFEFGFIESSLLFQSSSFYNVLKAGNNLSSGIEISDVGTSNWIQTGPPSTTQLPAVIGPDLGNPHRNDSGVPIAVYGTATLTPTSASSETLSIRIGSTNDPAEVMKCAVGAMTAPTVMQIPFSFIVKPGNYYKLVVTGAGSASISNLTLMQASAS